ncbi:MAG: dephospho-CoA kinase [Moorellales bacterium]
MVVIGLTGGIASGKSTVSRMLARLGACIIDADLLAREIVRPGRPAWRDIVRHFGREVLGPGGEIDRKALARRIFADSEARLLLNRLTHPRVVERTAAILRELARRGDCPMAVVDAPLFFEAGMDKLVDEVWVVRVSEETQIQRLIERDKLTPEEARQRLAAQMSLAERLQRAHRVIDNEGSVEETWKQVLDLWRKVVGSEPDAPGGSPSGRGLD